MTASAVLAAFRGPRIRAGKLSSATPEDHLLDLTPTSLKIWPPKIFRRASSHSEDAFWNGTPPPRNEASSSTLCFRFFLTTLLQKPGVGHVEAGSREQERYVCAAWPRPLDILTQVGGAIQYKPPVLARSLCIRRGAPSRPQNSRIPSLPQIYATYVPASQLKWHIADPKWDDVDRRSSDLESKREGPFSWEEALLIAVDI
ncbi:hypothetical protein EDB86DRAFT_3244288 [Lactarius hatsudake]|nr:hypothetical protein EDB86DRAFT_3244288 [Lactarius hatsudake]